MKAKMILGLIAILIVPSSIAVAQPTGPFTSDADTYLLLHLDGDLTDSGPNGLTCAFSQIAADPDPVFVASQTGFGQCLNNPSATGTAVEGILCASKEISGVTGPFTYECWINIPSIASAPLNHNPGLFDRGAGRCLWRLWLQPNGQQITHYLTVFDATGTSQYAYAVMDTTSGVWTWGNWHHLAVTMDTSKTGAYGVLGEEPPVQFFVDGVPLLTMAGAPAGTGPRTDYFFGPTQNGEIFGRPWPPNAPGGNLNWLVGSADEARFSTVDRYPAGAVADLAVDVAADQATITVDGDPSDWSSLASDPVALNTGGRGNLTCDVRYAWNDTYFYILIEEKAGDTTQTEAPNQAAFTNGTTTGPWTYDTVWFWMDLDQSNDGEQVGQDFTPAFGFSSTGRTDLYTARINNLAPLTQVSFAGAQVATGGSFSGNSRVIEAAILWSDLAATVDAARQPGGNLIAAIRPGLQIGCEPLIIDDDYNAQSFIGGEQFTAPSGTDVNSRDIVLQGSTTGLPNWREYR